MLKPYFVELTVTAVVMAESSSQAQSKAERYGRDIVSDCELCAESATEIKSLDQLKKITSEWSGADTPYDADDCLRVLLSGEGVAHTQERDTRTIDMFANFP